MENPNQAPALIESNETEKSNKLTEIIMLARRIANLSEHRTEIWHDDTTSGVNKSGAWTVEKASHLNRISTGRLIKVQPFQVGGKRHDGIFVYISPEGVKPDGYPVGIITLDSATMDNFHIEGSKETGFDIQLVNGQHYQSLEPWIIEDLISAMDSVEEQLERKARQLLVAPQIGEVAFAA